MTIVFSTERTSHHLLCPECGTAGGAIDHLRPGTRFGPWYCDKCGLAISGTVADDYTAVLDNTSKDNRKVRTLVLLRSREPLADGSWLHAITEGMYFPSSERGELGSSDEYYYNEHTCPTNWIRGIKLFDGDDGDPHGVFQWVKTILLPSQEQWGQLIDTDLLGHPDNWKGRLDASYLDWESVQKLFGPLETHSTLDISPASDSQLTHTDLRRWADVVAQEQPNSVEARWLSQYADAWKASEAKHANKD